MSRGITTPDEWREKLIELCAVRRVNDVYSHLSAIYNNAKEQIPKEYRLKSLATPKWLVEGVAERLRKEKENQRQEQVKPVIVVKPPTLGEMVAKVIEGFATQIETRITETVMSKLMVLETLIRAGGSKDEKGESEKSTDDFDVQEKNEKYEAGKTRKKVAIFGLLNNQKNELENEFKDYLRLAFPKDVDILKISPDGVIITKFCHSHTMCDKARRKFGRDMVFYCDGGIQSIKDKLTEIALT